MARKDVGPIYGVELISTLKLKGGMMQSMPSSEDLRRVVGFSTRTVAGYEALLSKYYKLIEACKAVNAAVDSHCEKTGSVIWIDPPYQLPGVHESVADRLSEVLDSCGEVL